MRRGILALTAALTLLLGGCQFTAVLPYARELEDMALMRTLGVDAEEGGAVAVTASSGVQSGGRDGGTVPPVMVTSRGESISAACLAMQTEGASYIFYGHVGQLLLGEELARRGVEPALDYVLRDVEMRLDTQLYVVRGGEAAAAISGATGENSSAAQRLDSMEEDGGIRSDAVPRTVKEVLADLGQNGCSYVPAITGQSGLTAAGYAILRDGGLVGWVDGEAAEGVNLLLGRVKADVVQVQTEGAGATLRVVGARTRVTPVVRDGVLTGLMVHCSVDANLAEAAPELNLRERAALEACQTALAQRERERIEEALERAKALNTDFLNLQKRAGLTAPWYWAMLKENWDFTALPIAVEVEARVLRSYDVER